MAERGRAGRDLDHYLFRSVWRLDAPPEQVFALLRDPEGYPRWWPQIRRLRRLDERSGEVVVRSLLPYDLVLQVSAGHEDARARELSIRLHGDLEGHCRWRVRGRGAGAVALFDQEVTARKPLLRRTAPVARPLLRANHTWMMHAGRRGLRRLLAAG